MKKVRVKAWCFTAGNDVFCAFSNKDWAETEAYKYSEEEVIYPCEITYTLPPAKKERKR